QALRIERGLDLPGAITAIIPGDGAVEIAVAHELHGDGGVLRPLGHRDVEMLYTLGDVGDNLGELRLAVGAVAVGEHAHGPIILADAIDASGKLELGAKACLEKSLDDLGVGKVFPFGTLARGNLRVFG